MNGEQERRLYQILAEFEEEINAYDLEQCNRKILKECGIAGLFTVKEWYAQAKLDLDREVDRYLEKNYTLDADKNLYDRSGATLVSFNEDNLNERFEIPDRVTAIGDQAFKGNKNIIEVIIPDSVTRIGNSAFKGCANLQKVWMGKGLGQINSVSGSNIFYGCQKLKEIHVGRIEDIKNFKHDNNPFTASFDLYVGGTLYNADITIQKECKSAGELDWIIFCKSIRKVHSDSGKIICRNGYITNYEEFCIDNSMYFPPLCIENIKTAEQLKEFGREHHLDISDDACSKFFRK